MKLRKKWFTLHFRQRHKRWTNRPGSWSRFCWYHIRYSLAFKWFTDKSNGKEGGCSDPGSAAEVVSSISSWWGINVIWHNGRIRKKLCLHSTLWQAHDGVWPRGRGPEWEEPKARSRVRGQGRVRITRESLWESEAWPSYIRGGLLSLKPFCALQTWAYKYFPVLFLHFASAINSKHILQKAKNGLGYLQKE